MAKLKESAGAPAAAPTEVVDKPQADMSRLDVVFTMRYSYPIIFTHGVFAAANQTLARALARGAGADKHKVLVFVDEGVAKAWPRLCEAAARKISSLPGVELAAAPHIVPGGEAAKNGLAVVENAAACAAQHCLDRHSFLVAIGGGAMLDAVGMAASLVHRGVRLVRLPTTVLAQNDAGIGVKNGVNAFGQKNYYGCFQPPWAVINDLDFIATLSPRSWRAGVAEAVKVACIKDADFFAFLEHSADSLRRRDAVAMEEVIRRCAQLHAAHIAGGGDPFENGNGRPLDFGHWSAHWLEMASGNALLHGEAVAIGIALDSLYAQRCGWLSACEAERVIRCLADVGFTLWHPLLTDREARGRLAMFAGLDRFREHLGGRLAITFPSPLGCSRDEHEIDLDLMAECAADLRRLADCSQSA